MASNLPQCRSRYPVNIPHWIKMKTTDGRPTFISFWLRTEDAVVQLSQALTAMASLPWWECEPKGALLSFSRLCQRSCPGTENNNRYRFSLLLWLSTVFSFLLLSSIPFCGSTVCFIIYILVDIWKTFRFKYHVVDIEADLRWRKRKWTFFRNQTWFTSWN